MVILSACKPKDNKSNNQISDIEKVDSLIEKTVPISSDLIEEFKNIDISKLNAELFQKTVIMSPKDIMKMYYPYEVGQEGKEEIIIVDKILSNGNVKVTLIHDYIW